MVDPPRPTTANYPSAIAAGVISMGTKVSLMSPVNAGARVAGRPCKHARARSALRSGLHEADRDDSGRRLTRSGPKESVASAPRFAISRSDHGDTPAGYLGRVAT